MKKDIDINNPEHNQFLEIMKELIETSELKKIMPAISMFGSARTKYHMTFQIKGFLLFLGVGQESWKQLIKVLTEVNQIA